MASFKASGMTLAQYADLVRNLPYLDQAFETKKETWHKEFSNNLKFKNYCIKEFKQPKLKISRRDLFVKAQEDTYSAIVSIIFWGYRSNMRGTHFSNILKSIESKIMPILEGERSITEDEFKSIVSKLKKTGVGLSTLTKFLYFFEFRIHGHRCLILDSRIIDAINDEDGFKELQVLTKTEKISDFNKVKRYVAYLQLMEEISRKNNYKSDQLELFIFSMGKNLKPSK